MPGICELCGEEDRPVFRWATVDPWGREWNPVQLCQPCIDREENREPPEPDGEAFRGTEAAEYEREQMAAIQRDLK